ncbi:MAG: DUF4365 domain-containing protein [Blastocatellia bacterium]
MLYQNDIKEELSYAYIHAVASRAGLAFDYRRKDRDSVDIVISAHRQEAAKGEYLSASLELQVKATTVTNHGEASFPFELPIKNYDDLRVKTMCPRLLVVYVMPGDESNWVTADRDSLCMRHCAYWHNLEGEAPVENAKSRTVRIPSKNVFTPESLKAIMSRVFKEEQIGYEL